MDDQHILRLLANLARSEVYTSVLKPILDQMQLDIELQRTEPKNEFEAVRICCQRLERIKVINKILSTIEGAKDKLSKIMKTKQIEIKKST